MCRWIGRNSTLQTKWRVSYHKTFPKWKYTNPANGILDFCWSKSWVGPSLCVKQSFSKYSRTSPSRTPMGPGLTVRPTGVCSFAKVFSAWQEGEIFLWESVSPEILTGRRRTRTRNMRKCFPRDLNRKKKNKNKNPKHEKVFPQRS